MFKAYSVGLQEKDFELIRKITKVVTPDHVIIKDLRYYDIKLEDNTNDVLFIFGNKASRLAQNISTRETVNLPEISKLHAKSGDPIQRQEALKKLLLLKTILETETGEKQEEIIFDPIPDKKTSDLKTLESTLITKEINKWLSTTKDGKTIQISILPEKSEADINITFSELYALRIAMETLDIKEFTIIYNKKTSQKRTT